MATESPPTAESGSGPPTDSSPDPVEAVWTDSDPSRNRKHHTRYFEAIGRSPSNDTETENESDEREALSRQSQTDHQPRQGDSEYTDRAETGWVQPLVERRGTRRLLPTSRSTAVRREMQTGRTGEFRYAFTSRSPLVGGRSTLHDENGAEEPVCDLIGRHTEDERR